MIYVFLADGFEMIEALTPVDILKRAGLEVKTVSVKGDTVTSSHGVKVTPDIKIEDIEDIDDVKALVLPGGMPGTLNLQSTPSLIDLIKECNAQEKYICAICAAPLILGEMGLLKGKNATCYPGFEEKLKGAVIKSDKVVKDSNIITAKGAGAALDFAFKIVEELVSADKALEIASSIQCR